MDVLTVIVAVTVILAFLVSTGRIVWRLVRAVVQIADAMPTLLLVAEQFKPNGGASMHDRLERLELGQRALLMDRGYGSFDDLLGMAQHEQANRRAQEHAEPEHRDKPGH